MQLSSNLILNEESNKRFQLIYTSQNYGTFYGVFGRFHVEGDMLKHVDFKLINYKGIVNLGINKITLESETEKILIEDPFNIVDSAEYDFWVFNMDIQALEKKTEGKIILNKSLADVKDKNFMFKKELLRMDSSHEDLIFDTEYKFRNGIREPYEYDNDFLNYKKGNNNLDDITISDKGPGGGICVRSVMKIII